MEKITSNNIKYSKPFSIVKTWLKEAGKVPQTAIHIYPDYPIGWHATVGVDNRVYIYKNERGKITLEIEPFNGFYPNGLLRRL